MTAGRSGGRMSGEKTKRGVLETAAVPTARQPPETTSLWWRVQTESQGMRSTAGDGDG